MVSASLWALRSLQPWSGRKCALGGLLWDIPTREGVAFMPTLRATREGRHSGCSAPAPFCSSVSFANASSSLPSRDAQGRAKSLALSPCDSRTHLTPLLQWPARGCLHPLLSGANGWWPPGAGRGEYTQFRLFAPLPLPPAREAAKNSLCLVERAGRGRKANSTLVIPPASPRPAPPLRARSLAERNGAALTCGRTPGVF